MRWLQSGNYMAGRAIRCAAPRLLAAIRQPQRQPVFQDAFFLSPRNEDSKSIGSGNTTVVFLSAPITVSVSR